MIHTIMCYILRYVQRRKGGYKVSNKRKNEKSAVDQILDDKAKTLSLGQKYIEEIEDVALVHQLLISKLRAKNGPEGTDSGVLSPFYRKAIIKLSNKVKEVEPEIDELNKVLIVVAPIIISETIEHTEQRKLNLKKEYLSVIASMNTAVSKELFNWFVSTADADSIERFVTQLSDLKDKKKE